MTHNYKSLVHERLTPGTRITRAGRRLPSVTLSSPAREVMTDLEREKAVTIAATAPIDTANRLMMASGVRLLFVTEAGDRILGIITATDLLGEKPMQYLRRVPGVAFSDITVQDIMTPGSEMEVLSLADVEAARVGDIVATLQQVGRQHAVAVAPSGPSDAPTIRGIFSTTQIGKQLGMAVDTTSVARTFAELEGVLAAHTPRNHALGQAHE